MNFYDYLGKFIRIYTIDQEWFIGEVIKINVQEKDVLELELNLFSSSKEIRDRNQTTYKQKHRNKNKGNHVLTTSEILKIEELDAAVQEGLKLTLTYNKTNNLDLKDLSCEEKLPKKVEFGWIEKQE